MNTKGKALRNLRKKKDKYVELDKKVRKGELQANEQQKAQIKSVPELDAEIKDLEALCKLYMESNPNYAEKVTAAPQVSEEDIDKAVTDAMDIVGKAAQLAALMQEDASFVECSDAERASMNMVCRNYKLMNDVAQTGSAGFTNVDKLELFTEHFTKLARSSTDIIRGSCTYGSLNTLITQSFSDNAQILQRIADADLLKKKEKDAADAIVAAKEAALQKAEEEKAGAALADDLAAFDVFGDDYGDETAAPAKPTPAAAPKKEAKPAATESKSEAPAAQDSQAATATDN